MKQVIIYPGRFQPMLSHHAEVYRQLQSQFPDADVYIGTSNKVEEPKSPFNFKEKQLIAQAHGIDPSKVLQANRPYHKDEYPFDENNTVIIFAVGEKDMDRFPMNNVDPETGLDMTVRGEPKPKYYQKINTYRTDPKPMSERGYITLAPTVKAGDEVASASAFRDALKNSPDEESAKQIYTKQFGTFDQKVFDLIFSKIKGNEMSEQLNILRKLAGLEPITEAPVQMPDFDKGERPRNAKERDAYRKWKKSQSASAKGDEGPLTISPKEKRDAAERPAKAAAADPTAVGFTKIKPEDMVDKRSGQPIPSKQRQKSIANMFPADADINDPAVKKEMFLKFTAKRPDLMFGEINARLANDDDGLAASDRLSSIVRELEDTRNIMELNPEDKKFALKILQNAIDNMELVRSTEHDKAIDVEPMQMDTDDDEMEPELGDDEMAPVLDTDDEPMRDSINFDDIRAEYGVEEGRRGKPGNEMEEASSNILAQIEDLANEYRVYGDCDMNTVNAGAEEVAACYSYSDGSESPDEFYDAVKELLADHGIGEAAEMEEAGRGSKALMPGGKLIIGKGEVAFHDDYGWMARGWGDDDFEYFDSEQQARDYVDQEYKRRKEISKQVDDNPEESEWERRSRHLANEPRVSAPRFKDDDDDDFEEGIEDKVCPHCDGSGCEECDGVGGDVSENVEATTQNAMAAAMAELRKLAGI